MPVPAQRPVRGRKLQILRTRERHGNHDKGGDNKKHHHQGRQNIQPQTPLMRNLRFASGAVKPVHHCPCPPKNRSRSTTRGATYRISKVSASSTTRSEENTYELTSQKRISNAVI